jgi:hypothetical protein
MALIYAFMCGLMRVLHKLAAWRHNRLKLAYEQSSTEFDQQEGRYKAKTSKVGRQMEYRQQIELLKLYEEKERRRQSWMRSHKTLLTRQRRLNWLRDLRGRKLPYTFGLVDMALVLKSIEIAPYVQYLVVGTTDLFNSFFG